VAAGPRATMDFFAAQAAARRRTAVLVPYFALAWIGTIALTWLGLALVAGMAAPAVAAAAATPEFLVAIAVAVSLVTAGGSAWHASRLRAGGGHAVARLVGGVPVDRGTSDAAERRLVNVVEEMAIASGLPVPAIYVLPREQGINAFAAGFTPDRAVVVVTRGAVEELDRAELQAVVAHEFSHILNSDSRLNLRLVSLIGGITILALAGRFLASEIGGRGRGGGRVKLFVLAVGACLWLAGSAGAFFGKLIRAAVSRQREFLADASAVQFTRNPDALAGALAKIARRGSALSSSLAPEVSHFFFANGLASRWLSTHPPIEERIRRVSPQGLLHALRRAAAIEEAGGAAAGPAPAPVAPGFAAAMAAQGPLGAAALVASVGRPEPRHVEYASVFLARVPAEVGVAARDPRGARALTCALLADGDPTVRQVQLAHLHGGEAAGREVDRLAGALGGASREDRMAIFDLALPALDGLGREEAAALVADLAALAAADGRTTVFEWAVQRIVRRRLAPILGESPRAGSRARTLEEVEVEALEILSVVAWLGARDEVAAQAALDAGVAALGVRARWRPLPRDRIRAATVDTALARLDGASPSLLGRIVAACAACALADGRVVPAEAEVVRAVAASLGCPVPPLSAAASPIAAGVG
jgi:Zn-dependent protease with chaperone function